MIPNYYLANWNILANEILIIFRINHAKMYSQHNTQELLLTIIDWKQCSQIVISEIYYNWYCITVRIIRVLLRSYIFIIRVATLLSLHWRCWCAHFNVLLLIFYQVIVKSYIKILNTQYSPHIFIFGALLIYFNDFWY